MCYFSSFLTLKLLTDTIDEALLAHVPRLNNIAVPPATRRRIVGTSTPGVLTETTDDFTWALLLATARRVAAGDAFTRAGELPSGVHAPAGR